MPKVKCFVVMTMSFDTKNARDKNCANSFCSSSLFNQLFVENEGKRVISVSNLVHCVRVKRPFLRKNFQVFLPAKQTSGGPIPHYPKSQIFVQIINFDKTLQFSWEIKVVNN